MSLPRFFLTHQVLSQETAETFPLQLDADDLKHFRVLRLHRKEHIAIVDASGNYYECEIASCEDELPEVRISGHEDFVSPTFSVALFQGLPKGDKMEDIVRHCTEIGVDEIVPVSFSRCVSKLDASKATRKRERWQSIAKSAAMQAGRMQVPSVSDLSSIHGAASRLADFDRVIVFWEEAQNAVSLENILSDAADRSCGERGSSSRVAVIIGPEGGLEEEEVAQLLSANESCFVASLGSNILRTETAALVGCAIVIRSLGGLGA